MCDHGRYFLSAVIFFSVGLAWWAAKGRLKARDLEEGRYPCPVMECHSVNVCIATHEALYSITAVEECEGGEDRVIGLCLTNHTIMKGR